MQEKTIFFEAPVKETFFEENGVRVGIHHIFRVDGTVESVKLWEKGNLVFEMFWDEEGGYRDSEDIDFYYLARKTILKLRNKLLTISDNIFQEYEEYLDKFYIDKCKIIVYEKNEEIEYWQFFEEEELSKLIIRKEGIEIGYGEYVSDINRKDGEFWLQDEKRESIIFEHDEEWECHIFHKCDENKMPIEDDDYNHIIKKFIQEYLL